MITDDTLPQMIFSGGIKYGHGTPAKHPNDTLADC
jgi:hypothetical protein